MSLLWVLPVAVTALAALSVVLVTRRVAAEAAALGDATVALDRTRAEVAEAIGRLATTRTGGDGGRTGLDGRR